MPSYLCSSSLLMDDPTAYSNSSSPFVLFPNSAYHSMQSSPSLQIQTRDIHSQSMYSSLSNYNGSEFSLGAVDSPASSSESVSLSNSDDSPVDSPVMIHHQPGDHPNDFCYDPDMFEQHLKSMFPQPFTDYSCGSSTESNDHFNIKQEHHQPSMCDSYQPYMDASTKSLSPYQHQHAAIVDSPEPLSNPETTPSLTYGFSNGYQNPSAPHSASSSSQNIMDPNGNYLFHATTSQPMRLPVIIPQQPCAQPTQVSPQCVNMVELSPSPPLYATTDLPDSQVCDPRFVSSQADVNPQVSQTENGGQREPQTQTSDLSTHFSIAAQSPPSYSGSQDSEEDGQQDDSMDDDDYQASLDSEAEADDDPEFLSLSTRSARARRRASASGALPFPSCTSSYDQDDVHVPHIGIATKRPRGSSAPIPVPNLTKKSRGRRVPTASLIASQGVGKNTRSYMCKVKDCGKCFARGEHLKRHVRSIHTNDKPHRCPFPGCGKDFSRHDNLGQHMRVHKGYKPPTEDQ